MRDKFLKIARLAGNLGHLVRAIGRDVSYERGKQLCETWQTFFLRANTTQADAPNDLRTFFDHRTKGAGVWKWLHYFEIYDHHLSRFRGRSPLILEIGIYSGGSLDMWRDYFGKGVRVVGIDIEPSCASYARDGVDIVIGDQGDREFWSRIRKEWTPFDVVIDDGGHSPEQQIITSEELLPHIAPGGVYICEEDVHGQNTEFSAFVSGLADSLNDVTHRKESVSDPERRIVVGATRFEAAVRSVHCYPFMSVIEFNGAAVEEFRAPKHGTVWEPFLK